MECQEIVRQILCNWAQTLQIDGQSGESFLTSEDIDRLNIVLISIIKPSRIGVLTYSAFEQLRNLKAGFTKIKILIL